MRSLMQGAIREAYFENPFDLSNIPYKQILNRMQGQNRNKVGQFVKRKNVCLKIKRNVKYFFTQVLKNEIAQNNKPNNKISFEEFSGTFFSALEVSEPTQEKIFSAQNVSTSLENLSDQFISLTEEESDKDKFSFDFSEFDKSEFETTGDQIEKEDSVKAKNTEGDILESSSNSVNNLNINNSLFKGENSINIVHNSTKNTLSNSLENPQQVNDSILSIDRLINESSINEKFGSPDISFVGVSLLKSIRKKYLTPEIYTHLNRSVRMVEGQKTNRRFLFKCQIQDTKLHIPEIGEILTNNNTEIPTKKLLEDFIRIGYLTKNNACDINFRHTRINKESFVAYGYCKDLECNLYTFSGNMNGEILVFRSQNEIIHCINKKKTYQCRGAQRCVEKAELSNETALSYQMKKINKQSDELRLVGRSQMIKSLSNIRNIKAESAADQDNDSDPFIDSYIMFKTKPNKYIQHLSTNLEVFMWSKKQIEILRLHNDFILKKINYTLHVDATGHVVEDMNFPTKRIFLYSIVGHIKESKIVFSVADAILSNHTSYDIGKFFKAIHSYCLTNKIKWPICKRIVTDISFAIIGAIIKELNDMKSLLDYLNTCFNVLNKSKRKISFICIQFCVSHYSKIICKDIDNVVPLSNVTLRTFLREALGIVFNLNNLSECLKWFEELTIILCTKKHIQPVNDAFTFFKNVSHDKTNLIKIEVNDEEEEISLSQKDENIGNVSNLSPFRILFNKSKAEIDNCCDIDAQLNIFFCPEMAQFILDKYIPFIPMWSNVIGSLIDSSSNRVSNGPIETYFKDVKHNDLKGRKHKLGRLIRKMRYSTKSRTKKIKILYNDVFVKPIQPGTLITPSKIKRPFDKKKSNIKILEIDAKKKLSKITESWNKKMKRLPHGLFNKSFEMVNKSMNEFEKSNTMIKDHTEIKAKDAVMLKNPDKACFKEHLQFDYDGKCVNLTTNQIADDYCENTIDPKNSSECIEKTTTSFIENANSLVQIENNTPKNEDLNYDEKRHKNLHKFAQSDINFFLLKLENVYEKTHGKHFSLTSYITLTDLETLNGKNWLSNVIVDACITCLMFENKAVNCSYIACQIDEYGFKNEKLVMEQFSKQPKRIIIPHCFQHHFYIVFLDLDKGYIICIDPKGNKQNSLKFCDYYLNILTKNFPKIKWIIKNVEQDIQSDAWNCGVFIVQFAERFLQSRSYTSLEDQPQYRLVLKNLLDKYGDSLTYICLHCGHDTIKTIIKFCCKICLRYVCTYCKKHYSISRSNKEALNYFTCKLCED